MPHHDRKRKVEKMLVDSGIPYVIIQPTVFMQMLTPAIQSVKNGGPFVQKFYTSAQTKMSYVDMKDYADAAAEIIVAGTKIISKISLTIIPIALVTIGIIRLSLACKHIEKKVARQAKTTLNDDHKSNVDDITLPFIL